MKKFFRSPMILLVLLSLSLNISCDILTPIDPELRDEHEAYYTIVEAHALKQLWIYDFFGTFSDNYTRGQLFVYEPTMNELNDLWGEFNVLMSYTDAVEAAIDTLESLAKDPLASSFNKTLASSGVVSSLFDFFRGGKAVSENSRKRILIITSNMPQSEKTELFNDMLRTKWRNEFTDENDFWTQLQSGDIDDKASQIYNDFYGGSFTSDNNTFGTLALDKNLTPGKIFVKEGADLVEKGAAVIVETAKAATPLGAGIDLVETGKKWWEKGEKLVDKPMDLVKDEIKERIVGKLAGMVDIDGAVDAAGLGEGAGTAVKALMDATIGTSDTQELIEKGIDWGTAKISSPDKSIDPEIVVAEKQNDDGSLPNIILGVGNYINHAGELLLTLPAGDWDITARDAWGQSNTPATTTITAQQETIVAVTSSISDSTDTEEEENLDIANLNLGAYNKITVTVENGSNHYGKSNSAIRGYEVNWSKNTFSLTYDEPFGGVDYTYSINGNVSLSSYDQVAVYLSLNFTSTEYNADGLLYREYETDINIIDLPFTYTINDYNRNPEHNFRIDLNNNPDLLSALSSYVRYNHRYTVYYTYGDDIGEIRSETNTNNFDFSTSSQPALRVTFSISD
ncbi:MAG: hypothetical protein KAH15_02710 [Candidatus Marinimicrobia bacterium]|nr:hypothetical protein [Candidatus Neomarinimicrobiota bacterium]